MDFALLSPFPSLPFPDSPDSSISALSRVAANFDFFGLHQSATEKKTEPRKKTESDRDRAANARARQLPKRQTNPI